MQVLEDADFADALADIRRAIPPLALARLRQAHDERSTYPFGCPARTEGAQCCLDLLLGDTTTD